MRDSISSNNQPWYFEDLRLGIVDPEGKLVSNVTLRAKKFLQSGFSKIKHKKLLMILPLEAVRRLSAHYKPLSSLEQLCLSEGKNINLFPPWNNFAYQKVRILLQKLSRNSCFNEIRLE
jgi:hypothetical protein